MADLTFNLSVDGPFEMLKTKSNTGAVHPLSRPSSSKSIMKTKVESMYCLQPSKIVEIQLKFKHPSPNNTEQWPNIMKIENTGELLIQYANGASQKLILQGLLLRPRLKVQTEKPTKNDYAQDELDFGLVNIDGYKKLVFFLVNDTFVTANWTLNYVKFPAKSNLGFKTITPLEQENLEKTDDPEAFEFSITSVRILF